MAASRLVYTAITNRHARLTARPSAPDTDFVCYSDEVLDRDDWQIRPIEASAALSPRMRAKYHKMFPPRGYKWTIWIDGAYVMRTDEGAKTIVDDFIAHSPSGFGLHRHDARDCLYDEAEESLQLDKRRDQHQVIRDQIRHYEAAGHPRSWGLWAGGLLCRDDSRRVADVMKQWWKQVSRWSWRDQISLPFVLRSLNFQPDAWPWPLFKNPYMAGWNWNQFDTPTPG